MWLLLHRSLYCLAETPSSSKSTAHIQTHNRVLPMGTRLSESCWGLCHITKIKCHCLYHLVSYRADCSVSPTVIISTGLYSQPVFVHHVKAYLLSLCTLNTLMKQPSPDTASSTVSLFWITNNLVLISPHRLTITSCRSYQLLPITANYTPSPTSVPEDRAEVEENCKYADISLDNSCHAVND